MNRMMLIVFVMILAISFLLAGFASGDGGQGVFGLLQGVGQGLYANNIVKIT